MVAVWTIGAQIAKDRPLLICVELTRLDPIRHVYISHLGQVEVISDFEHLDQFMC
jgi:hypothetical protein